MAFNPTDVGGPVDQSIPQWKRELILRRRAIGRTLQVGNSSVKLTCPAVVALVRQPDNLLASDHDAVQLRSSTSEEEATSASSSLNQNRVDFHPSTSTSSSAVSVGNMRLLDTCSDVNNLINGIDMKNKQSEVISSDVCVDYNLIMGEDKSIKKKSSSRSKFDKKVTNSPQNLIIKKVTIEERNGGTLKADDDNLSDSSEELQYGPGIVNKLKSKYLSMTLREQKRISRPSIINLRRATSLENMLEDGDINHQNNSKIGVDSINKTESKTNNCRATNIDKPVRLTSHQVTRHLNNRSLETMKRARSMDTLLKSESKNSLDKINSDGINIISSKPHYCNHKQIASTVNENIIIVENKHCSTGEPLKQGCSSNGSPKHANKRLVKVTGELPPHDVVKQTLKIFETSPKKKVNTQNQSILSKNVGVTVTSRNVQQTNISFKPSLSPKPVISPERLKQNKSRLSSPKKQSKVESGHSVFNKLHSNTLDQNFQIDHSNKICNTALRSDGKSVSVTSPKIVSPRSISPIVSILPNSEHLSSTSQSTIELNSKSAVQSAQLIIDRTESPILRKEHEETDGGDYSKPVLESALENIRRGGVTVQFSFTSEKTQNPALKSYLPRSKSPPQALNTSLVRENIESVPISNVAPLRQHIPTHTKQVGIIRPLMTRPHSSPALTEQEIEKNLINRVKSIEQPISKVVVAIKALPENVVLGSVSSDIVTNKNLSLPHACTNSKVKSQRLWDEKLWHQNQNTIVFNFSDRKEVPDYIENDGLILRGKRDRPRPGEGGIILLDAGAEESSTDIDDPPSPCDVTFEGDNILINGKSNLKKSPKQVKLRIKFNDEATTLFEYPSEASLIEEEPTAAEAGADIGASSSEETDSHATAAAPSSPRPLALGGSLGAYTPRQMGAGSWQLGVTPVQAPPTPTSAGPSHPPEEDHLKPAPSESTVAWSEDTASDLLF